MSTLEEALNQLVSVSTNIASVEFKKGNTQLANDLIQHKKLVREPDANENKLAAFCMGDSLLNKISDITKNVGSDDIGRILRSANSLNQICQNQELKGKIEHLASLHEATISNLSYLKNTADKYEQEIDLLTTKNTEQNMNIDNFSENEEAEEEIIRLEKELKMVREKTRILNKKKQDHIKMSTDIKELKLKNSVNDVNYKRIENIEKLQQEIAAKKKRIQGYDNILMSMNQGSNVVNTSQKLLTTKEIYTEFRERVEKLMTAQPTVDRCTDTKELMTLFQSIQLELKEILENLNQLKSTETYLSTTTSVYKGLLDYIQDALNHTTNNNNVDLIEFNTLIKHNKHTEIPRLELSKEAPLMTPILLKLFKEHQVKLSVLTTFVEELAKKLDLTERQGIQSIYKLVAAELIVIDRTHKDSLVKLRLFL